MNILAKTLQLVRYSAIVMTVCLSGIPLRVQGQPTPELFTPIDPPKAMYNINCEFEFDTTSAVVSGTETITLTNTSTLPMERLAFDWTLDSSRKLDITVNGESIMLLSGEPETDSQGPVVIELPSLVFPGHKLEIRVRFSRSFSFESDDNQHIWTDWFPRIYWGMQAQDDFVVKANYPPEFALASSGLYDSETDSYRVNGVRRYGICFYKGFDVSQQTVDGIEVRVFHTPAAKECAELVLNTAVDAINFYKKRFGFYPSNHLEILQGADAPVGGYPPATNIVVVHGMERLSERDDLHWRWITAHEVGHQYWFEYVMPEPPDRFDWLMIGLGIYMDREYCRYKGLSLDKHRELMERFINGVREGDDTRADVNGDYLDDIGFDFNNVVTHGKGFSIISALNCLLGDELFGRIYARCLKEFAGKRLCRCDFQRVCEQESSQNLDWFFDQWVSTSRFPAFEITAQECSPGNSGFTSDVIVKRTGTLDMPVQVTAYFSDQTQQTKFTGRMQPVSTLRFESKTALDSAVIDANHEIAMVIPPPKPEELRIRRELLSLPSHEEMDSLPSLVQKALQLNIKQTLFWGKLGRKLYGWGLYDDALAVFKRRTELLEEIKSEWVVSSYGWQGLLLDLLGRRTEAVAAYKKALETPTDREFSYDGDPVTISRIWLKDCLQKPFIRDDK